MGKPNYKQIFAIQKKYEAVLKEACPSICDRSGLYFLTREDEDGKYCYLGKGRLLLRRMVSHLQGYQQRIDISLKKRGFYTELNPLGWHLNIIFIPENQLDEKERYYIEAYRNAGYQMYNIESGGTTGKTMINERKPSKTYMDGVKQGKESIRKELKVIADKYLVIDVVKDNKISYRMLDKFNNILGGKENGDSSNN